MGVSGNNKKPLIDTISKGLSGLLLIVFIIILFVCKSFICFLSAGTQVKLWSLFIFNHVFLGFILLVTELTLNKLAYQTTFYFLYYACQFNQVISYLLSWKFLIFLIEFSFSSLLVIYDLLPSAITSRLFVDAASASACHIHRITTNPSSGFIELI